MDGRWARFVAAGVLCGLAGCSSLWSKKPKTGSTGEPPLSTTSAKPAVDRGGKNDGPPKVETLLAFANVQLNAADMPERPERDRDANIQNARKYYQDVLKREPKNVDALLGMARSYKTMRERDPCAEWYQRALQTKPANAAAIWGEMGQSLDVLQDRETAINCYREAARIDPNNKSYRKALGLALAHVGRYDQGYASLSRCMPPADAHICVARMMDHNGQHDLARAELSEALRVDPTNEIARLALNNASAPSDGASEANDIQTVDYRQYAPAPKRSAPLPPLMDNAKSPAASSVRTPDSPPSLPDHSDPLLAPAPNPGLMQPR